MVYLTIQTPSGSGIIYAVKDKISATAHFTLDNAD